MSASIHLSTSIPRDLGRIETTNKRILSANLIILALGIIAVLGIMATCISLRIYPFPLSMQSVAVLSTSGGVTVSSLAVALIVHSVKKALKSHKAKLGSIKEINEAIKENGDGNTIYATFYMLEFNQQELLKKQIPKLQEWLNGSPPPASL